jgi:hypothetical protein
MLSLPSRIEPTVSFSGLVQGMDVLPSRAPLPRRRTIHDRTLVVRRAHGRSLNSGAAAGLLSRGLTAVLASDQAYGGGVLLACGFLGMLAHLSLAPVAPLA